MCDYIYVCNSYVPNSIIHKCTGKIVNDVISLKLEPLKHLLTFEKSDGKVIETHNFSYASAEVVIS